MLAATRMAVSILKLRIGLLVAASALAGVAAAEGPMPSVWAMLALALAVVGASGAAAAFNHYYERDVDRVMRRTTRRPFASGALTPSLWWPLSFLALLAASLALAAATNGPLAAFFVFLGAFTYGIVYTVWLKRRTSWNIVVGGLAGSFAVLAGAAAVDDVPQFYALVVAVILFLWTPPHFWSLAAAQADDYKAAGVPMLPNVVGERTWTLIVLAHTAALVAASMIPLFYGKGILYLLGAGIGGGYFLWKSWALYRAPSRRTAIANFLASLYHLSILCLGVTLDGLFGRLL